MLFKLAAILVLTALPARAAGPVDVWFDDHDRTVMPPALCGAWQFKYLPSSELGPDGDFFEPDFDASSWKQIVVPSHWELEGFAEPKYGRALQEGTGLYRRHISKPYFPLSEPDDPVFLRFEGALYGLKAWVNGKFVGEWASGYNPVTFDVTAEIDRDGDNVIAVQVSTRPKGWEFDTNDCWSLSGLFREIYLFSKPKVWVADLTTETEVLADGNARLRVAMRAGGTWKAPLAAGGELWSPGRNSRQQFDLLMRDDGTGLATIELEQPDLWTAETPVCYRLEVWLLDQDQDGGRLQEIIGLREITIDGTVLKLNGRPVKLRGVNHHDIWPDVGRAASEEQIRRDLRLMREANINFIRTSHYPPHPLLPRLCDELGFYLMDEVPFGFGDEHLNDPSYEEILRTRARATVMRDKNHPSVIVWSIGNENPITDIGLATGRFVKELDPTRPICFPQVGSYFARNYERLPEWVDIYAPHYPVVSTLETYATTLTRPTIVTEYAHALGLATDRIEALWDIMAANPVFAGGAIWHFQDQGILRRAEARYDWIDHPNRVWVDTRHYYDTNNLDGADGIVYSDRTPQVDYFEVRKTYAPVRVPETSARVRPGRNEATIHVENRFDFRDLAGVELEWSLRENRWQRGGGGLELSAGAGQVQAVSLPVALPEGAERSVWALETRLVDRDGVVLNERTIRLDLAGGSQLESQLVSGVEESNLVVEENDGLTWIAHPRFTVVLERNPHSIRILEPGTDLGVASLLGPHSGRRHTMAEELRFRPAPPPAQDEDLGPPTRTSVQREGGSVRLSAVWSKQGESGEEQVTGSYSAVVNPSGHIEVSYDFLPIRPAGTILEAGFKISVFHPAGLRWIGEGPYAGYPGKERLNEFGIHHLDCEDLYFPGNRHDVRAAVLSRADGTGIAIFGTSMDLSVERDRQYRGMVWLSHNALLSGLGNKGVRPEVEIDAGKVDRIAGSFTVIPLARDWPEPLVRWFGPPREPAPVVRRPFVQSYDQ